MKLYSTENRNNIVSLKQAVMKSLASDKGLYMPEEIPELPSKFINNLGNYSFADIAFTVTENLLRGEIPSNDLRKIIDTAVNFPAPVKMLTDRIGSLELWHGPSLAFKDFGARFMAGLMSYYVDANEKLTILVATSGDTGGAVAYGFLDTPNIEVIILYPKGKVSRLQEQQLTTLGKNITAIEVNGTFDDCQAYVKEAFLDRTLNEKYNLSSANSINIARLIPQTFYYFEAYKQVIKNKGEEIVFSVPSGNFGNLTAGLLAQRMGLPVNKFIAATNLNHVIPDYLATGDFNPIPSVSTISNAMDVGNPSNYARMKDLFNGDWKALAGNISGYWYTDEETRSEMRTIKDAYDYVSDPHGAIGHKALLEYLQTQPNNIKGVFLETAHPGKFKDTVEQELGTIDIPDRLASLSNKTKVAIPIDNNYSSFKKYLIER